MNVYDLLNICYDIAPLDSVWSDDNVGLLIDREGDVGRVLVALDVSLEIIKEAAAIGAQVIISHHPVIFSPLKSITYSSPYGRRVMALIKNNIACICLHTNYDGAEGGINDELARLLGLTDVRVLVNSDGKYGRYGLLYAPQSLRAFAERVKHILKGTSVRAYDSGRPAHNVCVGSGRSGKIMDLAIKAGCDTLVTGDVSHDLLCEARDMGMNIIDAGHFATEDIMCDMLINELKKRNSELDILKAANNIRPYTEV